MLTESTRDPNSPTGARYANLKPDDGRWRRPPIQLEFSSGKQSSGYQTLADAIKVARPPAKFAAPPAHRRGDNLPVNSAPNPQNLATAEFQSTKVDDNLRQTIKTKNKSSSPDPITVTWPTSSRSIGSKHRHWPVRCYSIKIQFNSINCWIWVWGSDHVTSSSTAIGCSDLIYRRPISWPSVRIAPDAGKPWPSFTRPLIPFHFAFELSPWRLTALTATRNHPFDSTRTLNEMPGYRHPHFQSNCFRFKYQVKYRTK